MTVMHSRVKNFFVVVPLAIGLIFALIAIATDGWISVTFDYKGHSIASSTIYITQYSYLCFALLIIAILANLAYPIIFLNMLCVCKETPTFMYVCHNNVSIGTFVVYLAVLIIFKIQMLEPDYHYSQEVSLGYCYYLVLAADLFAIGAIAASVYLFVTRKNGKQAPTSAMPGQTVA